MTESGIDEAAIAEAAVWVARLQSDQRAPNVERDFRRWLAAEAANRAAFEAASDVWDLSGGVKIATAAPRRERSYSAPLMALAACLALLLTATIWFIQRSSAIETGIGERRTIVLADGSKVMLNTDTELVTRFTDDRRLILLRHGEASFNVAHDSLRPFIVDAGGTQVVAVGTVFDVRWTDGRLAVTLAQGKVRVVENAGMATAKAKEVELHPGQRMERVAPAASSKLAVVDLPAARAWRSGHVVFSNTPLPDAIREMNRYSEQPLEIGDGRARQLRISGSFRAGDSPQFARALAELYALRLDQREDALVLGEGL